MATTLTPDQASSRFGELTVDVGVGGLRVLKEFETAEGLWRPIFDEAMRLDSYRLFPKARLGPGAIRMARSRIE